MIKALSLAAALAVLPLSAALAGPQVDPASAEAAIEAAAARFEARMEAFGERAEAIGADQSLTEAEREAGVAALWGEYAPDVQAFAAAVSEHVPALAGQALADVDVEAIVGQALADVDVSGALAGAGGMALNGSWASGDPEHMTTYALMADYALGEAMDAADEATAAVEAEPAADAE